jgi:hypothetical protein
MTKYPKKRPMTDQITLGGIARVLDVSTSTAAIYAKRDDFPEPIGEIAGARVWDRIQVANWGILNLPLKAGRPPKHKPEQEARKK